MINILFLHKLLIYKRNDDSYRIFDVSCPLLFFFCLFLKFIPCFIDSFESKVHAFFFDHIFSLNIYTLLYHFLFSTSEKMLVTFNEHAFNKINTNKSHIIESWNYILNIFWVSVSFLIFVNISCRMFLEPPESKYLTVFFVSK